MRGVAACVLICSSTSVAVAESAAYEAIAPGATQPSVSIDRVYAVGTTFSSTGRRCRLGDAAAADVVIATRAGSATLVCTGEAGQSPVEVALVIAPVIIATQASPVRVGTPTIVHLALASAAEVGSELDVESTDVEVGAVERTDGGLAITVTARIASQRATVRVAARGVELGRIELETIAAPSPPSPAIVRAEWLGLEVGGHVGLFVPQASSTIGNPSDPGDAVSWGPLIGGRAGLFPTRRVGIELEAGLAPTGYATRGGTSALLATRAQLSILAASDPKYGLRLVGGVDLVAQLVGAGTADAGITGGVHYGAAFTIAVAPRTGIRVEVLHIMLPARDAGYAHTVEVQFGVTKRFGRLDRW